MVALICFVFSATAQNPVKDDQVPEAVKNSFLSKFPDIKNVTWQVDQEKYEAAFKMDGKMVDATFDKEGKFTSSETHLRKGELPPLVMASIKSSQFVDWKLNDAGFIETSENKSYYCIEMVNGKNEVDLLFDVQGNVVTK